MLNVPVQPVLTGLLQSVSYVYGIVMNYYEAGAVIVCVLDRGSVLLVVVTQLDIPTLDTHLTVDDGTDACT